MNWLDDESRPAGVEQATGRSGPRSSSNTRSRATFPRAGPQPPRRRRARPRAGRGARARSAPARAVHRRPRPRKPAAPRLSCRPSLSPIGRGVGLWPELSRSRRRRARAPAIWARCSCATACSAEQLEEALAEKARRASGSARSSSTAAGWTELQTSRRPSPSSTTRVHRPRRGRDRATPPRASCQSASRAATAPSRCASSTRTRSSSRSPIRPTCSPRTTCASRSASTSSSASPRATSSSEGARPRLPGVEITESELEDQARRPTSATSPRRARPRSSSSTRSSRARSTRGPPTSTSSPRATELDVRARIDGVDPRARRPSASRCSRRSRAA